MPTAGDDRANFFAADFDHGAFHYFAAAIKQRTGAHNEIWASLTLQKCRKPQQY